MYLPSVLLTGRLAEINNTLEFLACHTEIHSHLFELRATLVVPGSGAKALNNRRETAAPHFPGYRVSFGTFARLLLMKAKFAKFH